MIDLTLIHLKKGQIFDLLSFLSSFWRFASKFVKIEASKNSKPRGLHTLNSAPG